MPLRLEKLKCREVTKDPLRKPLTLLAGASIVCTQSVPLVGAFLQAIDRIGAQAYQEKKGALGFFRFDLPGAGGVFGHEGK